MPFWNIMPPSSGIIKPFLQTVVFIHDYHKLEYRLLRGYYKLYIVLFFSYFYFDQAFYKSGPEVTVSSFLNMYVFSFTVWIGNSITYKENSGLSHCSLKECSCIIHRSRVGMHKLHELIADLMDRCLYFNVE